MLVTYPALVGRDWKVCSTACNETMHRHYARSILGESDRTHPCPDRESGGVPCAYYEGHLQDGLGHATACSIHFNAEHICTVKE